MKTLLLSLCALSVAFPLAAQKKKIEPGFGQSDEVEIHASAFLTREEVKAKLGADLDKSIIVVEVKVRPKGEKPLRIDREDFIILSSSDGQRSTPFAPSQIAGKGSLTVQAVNVNGGVANVNAGPIYMPFPGGPGAVGNSTSQPTVNQTKVNNDAKTTQEDPLLALLKEKVLPEKETLEPVSGLLYFPIEGKVKLKDLTLIYKAPGGRMEIRFQR
jgi:hypothetical protein